MCGLFGIYGDDEASKKTFLGLHALQSRGMESAGIATSDGDIIKKHVSMGKVSDVFKSRTLKKLTGNIAIGHNRYSTSGASLMSNAQPFFFNSKFGEFAIAHNGNITNAIELKSNLKQLGAIFTTSSDTEVIAHLISHSKESSIKSALHKAALELEGAFCFLILTKNSLIAARDINGFRPLSIGTKGNAIAIASETCAFDINNIEYREEIPAGAIIEITENDDGSPSNIRYSNIGHKSKCNRCIFEHIYFSRPDSKIFSESVHEKRKKLGRRLAVEAPVDADIVIAVPDSSNIAALGFSEESGIPFEIGIIRSHFSGRTFIEPTQEIRSQSAKLKYNIIDNAIRGKRIVLVDDSIVRGTTSKHIVDMLKDAGALEIHIRVTSPPTKFPCYYGLDIPTSKELIAANHNKEEIRKILDVDSVEYLSMAGTLKQMGKTGWCTACFTGKYPVKFNSEEVHTQSQKD